MQEVVEYVDSKSRSCLFQSEQTHGEAMTEFTDVTILYTEQDKDWCNYVVGQFRSDKLNIRLKTIRVTDSNCDNLPEIETAVTESFVVVFLTTWCFMEFMRNQRLIFATVLQKINERVTTIVVATVDLPRGILKDVIDYCKYGANQWTIIDIDVTGTNIEDCISQILDIIDYNAGTLVERSPMAAMADTSISPGSGCNENVVIIPQTVKEGETVALIFGQEIKTRSVAIHSSGSQIPFETVNPYCVTFAAPEFIGTKRTIQVNVNNTRLRPIKLYRRQSPEFTSMELMCQAYGASSRDQLDQLLADKFRSSTCADGQAIFIFRRRVDNAPRGRQGSQYPTLLHWAAANGLGELCSALLSSSGALEACHIQNCDGDDVADLAEKNNYLDLSDVITEFTETSEDVMAGDVYVESLGIPSKSKGKDAIYETVNLSIFGKQPDPPKPHKQLLPLNRPFSFPPGVRTSSSDEEDNYILPESLLTEAASEELLEVRGEIQMRNFSKCTYINNTETLPSSGMAQYKAGTCISFTDRQKLIQAKREQNKKALEALQTAEKSLKMTKEKKKDEQESAGLRKKLGNLLKSPDSGSSQKIDDRDSGISNARDSRLSQTSTSSEEIELGEMPPFAKIGISQSDRAAGRASNNRKSVREEFLLLPELSRVSEPPTLPPRRSKMGNQVNISSSSCQPEKLVRFNQQ